MVLCRSPKPIIGVRFANLLPFSKIKYDRELNLVYEYHTPEIKSIQYTYSS